MKALPFLLLLFLCCSYILAQDKERDSITYLDEVILYDPVKRSKVTGITPSTTIRASAFQNQSPVDLASSINQISGVYMLSGALNTNRITIRGVGARTPFGTDKLRLYYNDIPVTNGTGFSTLEAFDLENLNSIEVIKGPKGTAFGTNLGGAILLQTKISREELTTLSNNFTLGSFGLIKNNFRFSHSDDKLNIGLQYNHLQTDGYRENNSFDRDGLLLNASYTIDQKNSVGLLMNYIDYTAQIPSSLGQTAFEENPRQAAFTWKAAQGFEANKYTLLGLFYTREFSERLKNTSSIFYTYLDHYEPRPFNILDEFTNGYGFRSRFEGNFASPSGTIEYTLGAELYKDEYSWGAFENLFEDNNGNGSLQGDRLSRNREFRRQFNGFGTFAIPITTAFKAQLGLNINKTHYDFRDLFNSGSENKNAKRNFDPIVLPSLDLEYYLGGAHFLYANVSRGFSNPSLEETLTPDGVINPDIKQETGTNYELGGRFNFWPKSNLLIDIVLYRMDIKNLLVADRVGEDQFIGRNAGETKHQGLELNTEYSFDLFAKLKVSPFFIYTLNDHSFVDFVDGDDDFSGNPFTGVPKHRFNLGIRLQHEGGFFWNTTYQYVGEIPLTDANTLSSDAFGILNSRMGYSQKLSDKFSLGINLGLGNVLDKKYARSVLINARGFGGNEPRYFYPGDGRNWYGGFSLAYRL